MVQFEHSQTLTNTLLILLDIDSRHLSHKQANQTYVESKHHCGARYKLKWVTMSNKGPSREEARSSKKAVCTEARKHLDSCEDEIVGAV